MLTKLQSKECSAMERVEAFRDEYAWFDSVVLAKMITVRELVSDGVLSDLPKSGETAVSRGGHW